MNWENIEGYSLTTVVIFLAGWFVKKWLESKIKADVEHKYQKELTQFKSDLEASKEKEIENLKSELNHKTQTAIASLTSQLNIIEAQNNVRFSRIFDKTATVIAELFNKILELKWTADEYTQLMEEENTDRKALWEKFRQQSIDFHNYYARNSIYLPTETSRKVTTVFGTMKRAVSNFKMALVVSKAEPPNQKTIDEMFEKFSDANDKIPDLLVVLHEDFQKLLGVAMETIKPDEKEGQPPEQSETQS